MKNSKLLEKTISKMVNTSFKEGQLLESRVVKYIKALKVLPKYEAIWALSEYLKGIKREQRYYNLQIESVVPLSTAQLKKIKQIMEKKHRITKVVTQINSAILGGLRLQLGDEVWDQSILNKIDQLKEAIVNGRSN